MKVLVCGATGFVGRNCAEAFARDAAYEVTGVYRARPPFDHPRIRWVQADLTERADVLRVMKGADVVIQAAATTSGVRTTFTSPATQIVDNAIMNSLIFAAAQQFQARHVVFFSCTIMLASADAPQSEADWDPREPMHPAYEGAGSTKIYMERMCAYYARLGPTRFTALRHTNIYGPHDKFDLMRSHVFGATVTKTLTAADGRVMVWGSGEEKRDLLHADDLADMVLRVVARQTTPYELYNVGLGSAISVRDLVARVIAASGRDLSIAHDLEKPSIKTSVTVDCGKALKELGWEPKVTLDEGIRRTLEWWRQTQPLKRQDMVSS